MDSRTAAHALSQIAAYLELGGENRFKARAYHRAARSLLALAVDDLGPLLRSGELAQVRGLGPATLSVVRDLVESGDSRYLEQLREKTPEGLLELMNVPGLAIEKIHKLYNELGIQSVQDLETAARSGALVRMKGMGPKTAQKLLAGIEFMRTAVTRKLYPHAIVEANAILAAIRSHPDVVRAEIAGSLRRRREVVSDVDVVAACRHDPAAVAQSFTHVAGVRAAQGEGATVTIRFVDGTALDLACVPPDDFAMELFRATGTREHVDAVVARLDGKTVHGLEEDAVYRAAGLPWVPPELREDQGEVEAAARNALPALLELGDLRGVLHCHTTYSDGKASIADMAVSARALGWSYLGISDHSEAAFYASGVGRDRMIAQHEEIDALNATLDGFRVLKGVEADILADGRIDYDADFLGRFDYVIASIHSRFKMDGDAMTARVLRAMDDPHMTILAHPTGRLLLSREPYALDIEAVLEKAAAVGVAIEVNADPHRMDLDWHYLKRAKELGVTIEIGPDAHSRGGLEWTELGVAMARKGWMEAGNVLNARNADAVLAFARQRLQ